MQFEKKFSVSQMVTNTDSNKTSATGVIGVLFCVFGLLMFISSVFCYFLYVGEATVIMTLLDKILILIGAGTCLLGVRKFGEIGGTKTKENDGNGEV